VEKDVDFAIGIINADATTAAALSSLLGVSVPTGLSGFFRREAENEDLGVISTDVQVIPIDAS
jgi:hypothetical protein